MAEPIFKPATHEQIANRTKDKQPRIKWKKGLRVPPSNNNSELTSEEYLQQNIIDLESILRQQSLYYPGAGSDLEPFKLFVENSAISTIIYCDYASDIAKDAINRIYTDLKKEYKFIGVRHIKPNVLGCNSWKDFWPSAPDAHGFGNPSDAFGLFAEMRRKSDNQAINFIYLCTEAIQTYKILFSDRRIRPTVVVIQDHGLGGFWTNFSGNDSKLYKTAKPALPRFLYVHGSPWPGYECVSLAATGKGMPRNRTLYIHKGYDYGNP